MGEQIVDFALQFQGYPYVYAGEGPYAFDCSGFTMFVIHNTLGIDIPHDMRVQYQMGRPVSRDELQPGDEVFFQNTFQPGMSHTGIYIGGGQFIHAETESSRGENQRPLDPSTTARVGTAPSGFPRRPETAA